MPASSMSLRSATGAAQARAVHFFPPSRITLPCPRPGSAVLRRDDKNSRLSLASTDQPAASARLSRHPSAVAGSQLLSPPCLPGQEGLARGQGLAGKRRTSRTAAGRALLWASVPPLRAARSSAPVTTRLLTKGQLRAPCCPKPRQLQERSLLTSSRCHSWRRSLGKRPVVREQRSLSLKEVTARRTPRAHGMMHSSRRTTTTTTLMLALSTALLRWRRRPSSLTPQQLERLPPSSAAAEEARHAKSSPHRRHWLEASPSTKHPAVLQQQFCSALLRPSSPRP